MEFIETRGNDGVKTAKVPFSKAILEPSASFGGLYVPQELPKIDDQFIQSHLYSPYKELAFDFLNLCDIDIDPDTLTVALNRYDLYDDPLNPVPLEQIEDDCFVSELYHGPTRAFKDMALQPFGYILGSLAKERDERYIIMAATSGDTGPATLETFKNQENVKVVCLYPDGGTSDVQRLQMVTEDGANLHVFGVKGDFDDTQNALKSLLSSKDFNATLEAKNVKLSAANSVNFGRIIFQIIYHIYSYIALIRDKKIEAGKPVYLVVPSGNFGNALGAYYAKKMGIPIKKILITSNQNNVLTDLIQNGEYDLNSRELVKTISPAMDILKSSNVERVLFDKFGATRTKELMEHLVAHGFYRLSSSELDALREDFDASFSTDEECESVMGIYATKGYIMDPHTATCIKAYEQLREEKLKTIIYSTAEWTKFSPVVAKVLGGQAKEDIEALSYVSKKASHPISTKIQELFSKPIIHKEIISKDDIQARIIALL
ncbi:MAG TPA: threonine synthase [Epsilonproteobacteria bacterium]|nr:threonine synthase [Campylobacterota bacterium]